MLRSYVRRRIVPFSWRGRAKRLFSSGVDASIPPITPIEKIIMDGIKATGPISFSTYMQMCLSHPTQGYYMNPRNPIFGAKGDFVTSPEISSIFGEVTGGCVVDVALDATAANTNNRAWAGARDTYGGYSSRQSSAKGEFNAEALAQVVSQFAGDHLKEVVLVETSPTLRALQEARLSPSAAKYGCTLEWRESVDDIPVSKEEYFTMVVAHEFFDALPFHTIEKTEHGWQELLIALAEEPEAYPRFRYVLAPEPTAASNLLGMSSPRFKADAPVGTRLEVSPSSFRTMRDIGELLALSRGCGLIIDYGAAHAFSQSFRAFKNHEIVDVFHAPGECDLTANVDFAFLAEAVRDLDLPTHGPLTQAAFLENMGLQLRVEALVRGQD
ncbi:Protein arginine methyltransferase NDUFAF7 [Mycena sanguinolenta]|uniref:Protein arginine methyltransferase NDUFAF7 n=1 Tax=Mycena sanguinolenta TaxID=230812 RepID=A0A8H6ZDQ5_9AGAR|nr:Protein arginine methyltransferase NDUFAF7 [Mycena sanguinolenta]